MSQIAEYPERHSNSDTRTDTGHTTDFHIPLSVTIITKNEAQNIRRCLESVAWADEIIVVDSGSTDQTLAICREFGCKVSTTEWRGFGFAKQFAVEQASHTWILSIDADEQLTLELAYEIQLLLKKDPPKHGYKVKRASFYLGKPIRHCGWDQDQTLRVFNKQYGSFNDNLVHESVILKGEIAILHNLMLHYTYPTLTSHFTKMQRYAALGAETLFAKGKSSHPGKAIIRGVSKFVKMYLLQLGLLDGTHGFLLCLNSAWGVYLKYMLLWEMNRSK